MDDIKNAVKETLKKIDKPIPFYMPNHEITYLVKETWKKSGINGLDISDIGICKALSQMGYRKHRTNIVRGWIIDKV